jgi:hypothetical protein
MFETHFELVFQKLEMIIQQLEILEKSCTKIVDRYDDPFPCGLRKRKIQNKNTN